MLQTICICGAGTMGSGIALVAAQAGYSCLLYDLNPAMLDKARQSIQKQLQHQVEKNLLSSADNNSILERIRYSSSNNDCIADLIIEAIVEQAGAKINLFNQLAEINHSETIFASNTSSISISAISQGVKHPERVLGMHFFNPAPKMKLVEIVKGTHTSDVVAQQVYELAILWGKTPVLCRDAPGFIVNHVARPYYLEALRLVESGVTDIATVDRVLEAIGFRMGPFRLMDLIGNDINLAVSQSVFEQLGRPERLRPSALQAQKVAEKKLGRKSGEGYYSY